MNREQIQAEIDKLRDCGLAVMKCPNEKRVVFEKNIFKPEVYGPKKYSYQCVSCLRKGPSVKIPEGDQKSAVLYDEAKAKDREKKLAGLYEQMRTVFQQEKERDDQEFRFYYESYLQTDTWRLKRRAVMERAGGICEGCRVKRATQVHHLTYEMLGHEMLFQLVAVCDECHLDIHESRQRPPLWKGSLA